MRDKNCNFESSDSALEAIQIGLRADRIDAPQKIEKTIKRDQEGKLLSIQNQKYAALADMEAFKTKYEAEMKEMKVKIEEMAREIEMLKKK